MHASSGVTTHYTDFDTDYVYFLAFLMAVGLGVPAFVMARCARTSAFKPVFALCLLQQSPLIVGFLMQVALMFNQDHSVIGLVTALATLSVASSVIAGGSLLGVKANGLLHRHSLKAKL